MTKQEQIEQMIKIFTDNREVCHHMRCVECKYHGDEDCVYSSCANALYQAGYGNISEYKAEIEQLKAKSKSQERENGFLKYCQCLTHGVDGSSHIKKAQIDVLNKAKERLDSAPNGWAYTTYIDELIEEVENETKKETSRSTL